MKTAIVYYSMSENTTWIAERVAEVIGKKDPSESVDLIRIEPVKAYPSTGAKKFIWGGKAATMKNKPKLVPYEFDADRYDRIIIGTPVWAGTFTPPIRSFIEENRNELEGKKIAAFASSSGGQDQSDKALSKLKKFLGLESLIAEFGLTDPKDKPEEKNDALIRDFCEKIQ